jgi:hypothetical protein
MLCYTYIASPVKKNDKLSCENYWATTLLSDVYKVLSGVMNERLKACVGNIFGEYQCG